MKRLLTGIMAAAVCFSLAGCAGGGNSASSSQQQGGAASPSASQENGEKPALSGEITFSTWGSLDEKKVNEEVIAAFEAKYPGTKVNLEYIPEKYTEKIDTMFMGGNAPDVIYGHPHYFANWAEQGLLMDLTDRVEAEKDFYFNEKFAQNIYDAFRWNGKYIATINGHDTYLLYYNKDLFDAAGVAYPDDSWTWDSYVEAARKLTREDAAGKQYATIIPQGMQDSFPILYSFGASIFDDMNHPTKVTVNTPEMVEGMRFIQDLVQKYGVAPDYQSSDLTGGSFETGRVAMDIAGSWSPASRKNITDFKWDMANLPMKAGSERRTTAFFAGYAVNANTKNPDLAYEFARFFQDDEGQNILSQLGLITVINKEIASKKENLEGPGMPEHHALRVSSIDYATNGYGFVTNWGEMAAKVLQPNFDQLVSGKITPEECAKAMQEGLEPLLESGKVSE
ncbi:MAG: sugar ABC transporter substrate-binding protein [Provencibacterium sp.]|jgi:multiple sugar transport system substrate-binding protein|nr:sugar ABC transporter substrate-binding protein [Provencibacterium sp.]